MPNDRSTNHPLHLIGSCSVLGMACLASTPATADIVASTYHDPDNFMYVVRDMPDFDQDRAGVLPANGRCYCGPATLADLLGYAATHGYPDLDPGIPPLSWYQPFSYDTVSDLMFELGEEARVEPGEKDGDPCGTGTTKMYNALVARLGDRFTVRKISWSGSRGFAPSAAQIAKLGVIDQSIGIVKYGRWAGEYDGETWVSNHRRGGHFEAVNQAIAHDGSIELGLRNPSNDDDGKALYTQSTFRTHIFDVNRRAGLIEGHSVTVDQLGDVYLSSHDHDNDPNTPRIPEHRLRFLESYIAISPKACYGWDDFTNALVRLAPNSEIWSNRSIERVAMAMPGSPSRVALGPDGLTFASIIDGMLHRSKRDAPGLEHHEVFDLGIAGWQASNDVAFDDEHRLHVTGGDRLATIDWLRGEVLSLVQLPGEATSIAIDGDVVYVLIPEMEMVVAVRRGLQGVVTTELPLPDDALVLHDSTIDMLSGGRLFLLSDGTVNPMQVNDLGIHRLWMPVPRDGDWTDISIDDNDTLCLLDRQGMVEAHRVDADGFHRNLGHALDGEFVGKRFVVARSITNVEEIETELIDSTDLDIDDRTVELDCPGDLNFDRVVDSADIGLMLGEWGAPRSIADLDRNGTVDSGDLGLLLGAFGGCQ